jgi:hypothetical protein
VPESAGTTTVVLLFCGGGGGLLLLMQPDSALSITSEASMTFMFESSFLSWITARSG